MQKVNIEYYEKKIEDNIRFLDEVNVWLKVIPWLKVLFFVITVFFLIAAFHLGWHKTHCLVASAVSFVVFLFLYRPDEYYLRKRAYYQALNSVYINEISFLTGDYSPFDNGMRFMDKNHPYSYDMDIFGNNSIYHMINRTISKEAGSILADRLTTMPENEQDIIERQEALLELSRKEEFRYHFMAICKGFDKESDNYSSLISNKSDNTLLTSTIALVLIYVSIILTLSAVVLSYLGYIPSSIPVMLFLFQLFFPLVFNKTLNKVGGDIGYLHKNTMVHAHLLKLINNEVFETKLNTKLKDSLFEECNSQDALKEIALLLKKFDQRHNAYVLVLLNGLFMRDLFLLRRFYRWKSNNLGYLKLWISLLAEMEVRVSQASYMFNLPKYVRPIITNQEDVLINAKQMGHPFIDEDKRVDNSILIRKKKFFIITGANMAGKSTFLRTVGANYVLAVNGMNVCASKFEFSLFHLFSSMRNTDNLSSGTSYFKAELERIRQLIRFCHSHHHTLIILDELLKGTNSKDKLDGSVLFLKKMMNMPVTGIIATHDLELAKLEEELPEIFNNYCFEISLSDGENYSYKIQRGISKNLNATILLQKILSEEL